MQGLFEQLPEALRIGRLNSFAQKKRSAPMQEIPKSDMRTTPQSSVQIPTDQSTPSSGTEAPNPKHSSRDYKSQSLQQQTMTNLESAFGQSAQEMFGLTNQNSTGFQQSLPPMGTIPSNTTQSTSPTNTSRGGGFPDLSIMMFPTNDPFAYPNQPMTTLENLQDTGEDQTFNIQMFNGGTYRGAYSNLNAPFYGPLPSYQIPKIRGSTDVGGTQTAGQPSGIANQNWTTQQPGGERFRCPPVEGNWDAMFGEDWSGGWTDQGYRQ